MTKCLNIHREAAQSYLSNDFTENCAWISIGEPNTPDSIIHNNFLDKLPNLRLQFWDVEKTIDGLFGELYAPPTKEHAAQIVDFVLENKPRNFLINCAAGISRSGAICAFLEKHLGYEWLEEGKQRSLKRIGPNKLLLRIMEEYYYE